jgi:hypothetical protein
MRSRALALFLFGAVLMSKDGIAQVYYQSTPPPQVNAANETWQLNGEPVFSDGYAYYPTGPTVFFDGNAMARTGVYRGIPLYQDRFLEPHSIVYVPIRNTVMRPYERRREGELAGTTGSRTPSFPVQVASPITVRAGNIYPSPDFLYRPPVVPEEEPLIVLAEQPALAAIAPPTAAATPRPAQVTITAASRRPVRSDIWIEFNGARWYKTGAAVTFDPTRFVPAGDYRGFLVYRAKSGGNEIYVSAVSDGGLTPYARR